MSEKDTIKNEEQNDEGVVVSPSSSIDDIWCKLQEEATTISKDEPTIESYLQQTILNPKVYDFKSAVALIVSTRLFWGSSSITIGNNPCRKVVKTMMEETLNSEELELGHTMIDGVREDILVNRRRDPACKSLLEVLLFYKGFAALVCHRAARRAWGKPIYSDGIERDSERKTRFVSLWLQSQASVAFGVDIHPCAEIGSGVLFDHATSIVIGETAKIGDGCTVLHEVTLGGTGKVVGDRHPKLGNNVFVGAGSKILGNITIGHRVKIGAGSLVLKSLPNGVTAVGVPAKIVGYAMERRPGSTNDASLRNVIYLVKQKKEESEVSLS